jgi:REP element-mobilizing transposase RayT
MPRKPRIEIPGYYHIINRGVEQRDVFIDKEDFLTFEKLLCKLTKEYEITLHNFCLMNNHYHLLIELQKENLSYAI